MQNFTLQAGEISNNFCPKPEKNINEHCTFILHHGRWNVNSTKLSSIYSMPPENESRPEWYTRVYNYNFTDISKNQVDMSGNSILRWSSKPKKCLYRTYKLSQIQQCFANHYNNVQFYGDSRARQYYASLRGLLSSYSEELDNLVPQNSAHLNYFMNDETWRFGDDNQTTINFDYRQNLYLNDQSLHPISLHQSFNRKNSQVARSWYQVNGKYTRNATRLPDLIISPAMILHPLSASGNEARYPEIHAKIANQTHPYMDYQYNLAISSFKDRLLPFFKKMSRFNSKMVIIILESEKIKPNRYEFDEDRNFYIEKYNHFLRKMIPDEGISGFNIYRVSINEMTALGMKRGDYLTADRIHAARKDSAHVISPPLLAHWNVIFKDI